VVESTFRVEPVILNPVPREISVVAVEETEEDPLS
jgi:hypothetical protein